MIDFDLGFGIIDIFVQFGWFADRLNGPAFDIFV